MPKKKDNAKKELLTRPKGMRDIRDDAFYHYVGFFERASEIAVYYGFRPIETPILEKEWIFLRGVGSETDIVKKEMYTLKTKGGDALVLRPEGTAPVMRAYIENGMQSEPQPVMLYYYGPFFRHERPQRGREREFHQFGLEVLGTSQNIADAMVIQLTYLILKETGFKNLCILINSIGCGECRPGYTKALTQFYRKHISTLDSVDRERLKVNPLRILDSKDPNVRELNEEAPESVSYLCDACKKHFRGVFEYLDAVELPYRIDHRLVRGLDYYTRTVFEIITETNIPAPEETKSDDNIKEEDKNKEEPKKEGPIPLSLASGGRYDNLAKRLKSKRDIPGVGSAIGVDRVLSDPQFKPPSPRFIKKPRVYFIQIGTNAKQKGLVVIEALRKAHIPVAHALSKDTLSAQLAIAEKLSIPFVLIMGQKESVSETIIVRDMKSRSQETVPLHSFAEYLKKQIKTDK